MTVLMSKRSLGSNTTQVSCIGFGGMPLSEEGRPSESDAIRVIHRVFDAGVTLIDTSNVYCAGKDDLGHNERLIAKALGSWTGEPDDIVVATKGGRIRPQGCWEVDARPEKLREACEASLLALGVDQIALYQLNIPDPHVPFEESVGALADLQQEGKIRWVGLSNVTVEQTEAARAIVEVASVQNRLNPFFREAIETGVVSYCSEQGLAFIAYHPVGGSLSKELGRTRCLRRIAGQHGVSPHAVALAWCLAQGPSVIPIPSARTVGHALDSHTAAGLQLSQDELAAIGRAGLSLKAALHLRMRRMIGRLLRHGGFRRRRRGAWADEDVRRRVRIDRGLKPLVEQELPPAPLPQGEPREEVSEVESPPSVSEQAARASAGDEPGPGSPGLP